MPDTLSLPPDQAQRFRQAVAARMAEEHWGNADLARETGWCPSEITKRLIGSKPVRVDFAWSVAKALQIPMSDYSFMIRGDELQVTLRAPAGNSPTVAVPLDVSAHEAARRLAPDTGSLLWHPVDHCVGLYFNFVLPFFKKHGPELVVSDWPITRLVTPAVQRMCLEGRTTPHVIGSYVEICVMMSDFWSRSRRSKNKARIVNILPLERFRELVQTPPPRIPACLRERWSELRGAWLEDLKNQIEEGKCLPLFVRESSLKAARQAHRDVREILDEFSLMAIVSDDHMIRRIRSTSELAVTSNSSLIDEFRDGLNQLETLARKEAGEHPEDQALREIKSLKDWCDSQPR